MSMFEGSIHRLFVVVGGGSGRMSVPFKFHLVLGEIQALRGLFG